MITFSQQRIPPMDNMGVVVASMKDIFKLVDEFPSKKKDYGIDWNSYWRMYSWCWVAPHVLKSLKDFPDIGASFKEWDGNFAENRSKSSLKKKYDTKSLAFKKAKLLGTYSRNFTQWADFRLSKPFKAIIEMEAYEDMGAELGAAQRTLLAIMRLLKSKNLEVIPAPFRKIALKVHFIQDGGKWVSNYEMGVLQINMTALDKLSLPRQAYQFLVGLSLAYLPLMFRTKAKTWFRFYKKRRIPVRSVYLPAHLSKAHQVFAIGVADIAFERNTLQAGAVKHYFGLLRKELDVVEDVEAIEGITEQMVDSLTEAVDEVSNFFPELLITPEIIAGFSGLGEVGGSGFLDDYDMTDNVLTAYHTKWKDEDSIVIETENADNGRDRWRGALDEDYFRVARTITRNSKGEYTLYNDEFYMPPDYRGGGAGMRMIGKQIDWCIDSGINKISCHAARVEGEFFGYKVWHKMGYDGMMKISLIQGERKEFFDYVLQSNIARIEQALMGDLYSWMNRVCQRIVTDKATWLTRLLPESVLYDIDDRYTSVRFEGKDNDFMDIVENMTREDFVLLMTTLKEQRERIGREKIGEFFVDLSAPIHLSPLEDTIQNLMDIAGFEQFWSDYGKSWKATLDLSDGKESEAYLIYALYQEKKTKMATEGFANTKGMGELSLAELELFNQARREIRDQRKQAKRIASKWLS